MKDSELTEFELEDEGLKLRITRDSGKAVSYVQHAPQPHFQVAHHSQAPAPATAPVATAPKLDASHRMITSPMVGTFYSAATPDSPKYVNIGSKVSADTVVGIIEAMKVMNEIQSEIVGEIIEVLVQNEQAVEYGQPLFKVKVA